jgi:outer membrane protein, heavy metal efflux system
MLLPRLNKTARRLSLLLCLSLETLWANAQQTLTLAQALATACAHNPELTANAQRVEAARGSLRQASLAPNPRLYLSSEDLRPWSSDFSFANNTEDFAYIGQAIETAGKRGRRVAVGEADLRRTRLEAEWSDRRILAGVASAYWTAQGAAAIRDLLQNDLEAIDASVRYDQERVRAGAMAGVDLIRMQIERDRIYLSSQAAERDATTALLELFRKMGVTANPSVQFADRIDTMRTIPAFQIAQVIASRPDVQAAEESVQQSVANLRLQQAVAVPDLDLLGGYKRNSGVDTLYGALQVNLPFRNRNQGAILTAQADEQIARANLATARLSAETEIRILQETYDRQQRIVSATLPEINRRATDNLRILQDAYRSGGADLLRLIDAQRTLIDIQVQSVHAWADYQRSATALLVAIGEQP